MGQIKPTTWFCMAGKLGVFTFLEGFLGKKKKSNIQYDCMIHRVNNIYYLAIYRKSLPAPASIHYGLKLFFQKCADSIFLKENWKERILKENLIFKNFILISHFVVVQSLSCVRLFTTPWIAAPPGLLSLTISWSLFTHYLLISQIYFYLLIIYLLNKQFLKL